jgi:hypothetical protein
LVLLTRYFKELAPMPQSKLLASFLGLLLLATMILSWAAGLPSSGSTALAGSLDQYVPEASSSVALYKHPHAVWLTQDQVVGDNLGFLQRELAFAKLQNRRPEFVIYFIPERDLGQSSEGGFATFAQYAAENELLAAALSKHNTSNKLKPRIYLEPDALGHALTYLRTHNNDLRSTTTYGLRVNALAHLVELYSKAGCLVYLDVAHGHWFASPEERKKMAKTLVEAGYNATYGLVTNISNRQPITPDLVLSPDNELAYMKELISYLPKPPKDVVVDTSRNGGLTFARQYYLAKTGNLYDNEVPKGRWVGTWRKEPASGELIFYPLYGQQKRLTRLLTKEAYQFSADKGLLLAPPWLDPVGDVQLGKAPTDETLTVAPITKLRFIKLPDDCDGSLGCPPGQPKQNIVQQLQKLQAVAPALSETLPWSADKTQAVKANNPTYYPFYGTVK